MNEDTQSNLVPAVIPVKTDSGHGHARVGHVVDLKILFGVLFALLFLTWLTVAATYLELGNLNIVIAILIATVKASLVCLFFMHLYWDKRFNLVIFVASLAFLGLFIGLAMMDKLEYHSTLDQGDSPKVVEQLEAGN